MFVVAAKLKIKSANVSEFMSRLRQHVKLSLEEGRCVNFDVHQSMSDDQELLYYEVYNTKGDFDEHINSSRVKTHISNTSSMIDGDIWFAEWSRISDEWR